MLTVITLDIFSEEGSSLYFFSSQFRQSPLTLIKSVLYHMISLPWTKLRQHSVFIYPHVQCFPRKVVIPNPFSCLALSFFYLYLHALMRILSPSTAHIPLKARIHQQSGKDPSITMSAHKQDKIHSHRNQRQ